MRGDFDDWFEGSVVVDVQRAPLRVFRGEHGRLGEGEECFQSRCGAITFSTAEAASFYATHPNRRDDLAECPRVTPAFLRILRPVMNRPDDPFVDMSEIAGVLGSARARRVALDLAAFIENTCNWMDDLGERYESVAAYVSMAGDDAIRRLYVDAYAVFDSSTYVHWFRAAGFDGAVHGGSGETAGTAEYKVFGEDQVWPGITLGNPPGSFPVTGEHTSPAGH